MSREKSGGMQSTPREFLNTVAGAVLAGAGADKRLGAPEP